MSSRAAASTRMVQTPSALVASLQRDTPTVVAAHKTQIVELLNMADYTAQTECVVDVDKPIFQPFPPVVEFRGYKPFEPTAMRVVFRNNDRFARRMRVVPPESPFFKLEGPFSTKGVAMVDGRIAPGTEVVYNIVFHPHDVDDYMYELLAVTEREKFVVPIRALGKRALLTMPDSISFPTVPVKTKVVKSFVIRNAGARATEVTLTPPPGFLVSPARAHVDVDGMVPISVTFIPPRVGELTDALEVTYAEGYRCYMTLSAAGVDVDVSLSAGALALDATYVSLQTQGIVSITNKCVHGRLLLP